MKKRVYLPILAGLFIGFSACEHKDLCYNHDKHALKYQILAEAEYELEWQYTYGKAINWKAGWPAYFGMDYNSLRPDIPGGLRVLVYGAENAYDIVNLPAEGGLLSLPGGGHPLLFYNNDTEYILFDDLNSIASAKATTRTRTRATYLGNPYVDLKSENTVNPPDVLFGHYEKSYTPEKSPEPQTISVSMHPLVYTYLIRYEFESGLQYVALARGALAGMAGAVYLHNGRTAAEEATVLYDCTVEEFGAQAIVNSFGVPDYPNDLYTKTDGTYGLNLEVRLKNGKILSFDFDVTEQVAAQPRGGVIVVEGIRISDEEGMGGSSGFNVNVEGWGEYDDILLPL